MATINGTSGNDTITGNGDSDEFYGFAGDDTINAGGGNDTVYGGTGNDSLFGGFGNDTLVGGEGNDRIAGGDGADTFVLFANSGTDTIFGGAGSSDQDLIQFLENQNVTVTFSASEAGTYTQNGGATQGSFTDIEAIETAGGNDTINASASSASQTVFAGAGNDTITGGGGADRIEGGDGNDIIFGGNEASSGGTTAIVPGGTTIGTNGTDTFTWAPGTGNNATVVLDNDGGTENDGDDVADAVYITSTANGGTLTIQGFDFNVDRLYLPETPISANQSASPGVTTITITYAGGNQQTVIINHDQAGSVASSSFYTVGSPPSGAPTTDDSIDGGAGNDTIFGGSGRDLLYGGSGNDSVHGGAGDDTLHGDAGSDTVYGGAGNDTLFGGDDDDDFLTGNGDTAFGGSGDDHFYHYSNEGTGGTITWLGGETGEGNTDPTNGSGGDIMRLEWDGTIGTVTSDLTVTYTGFEAGTVTGGTSSIIFSEMEGVITGDGNDVINAQASSGGQSISSGAGNDIVTGSGGNDFIFGGAGNDVLEGGAGNDTLVGGSGDDTAVFAGTVADYIYDVDGAGNLLITHIVTGAVDTVSGVEFIRFSDVTFDLITGTVTDNSLNDADNDGDLIVAGAGNDNIGANAGNDAIYAGAGNDNVGGGAGDDTVFGGAGDDTMGADAGNDTVYGGDGNDIISGNAGNDTVIGDAGDDLVGGGDGNDTLYGGTGNDGLYAEANDDTLYGGEGNDSLYGDSGNDLAFGGTGNDSVYGDEGNDTLYGDAGNDLVFGWTGNDTLFGGDGDDILSGDEGNDTVNGDAGNDDLSGFDGDDTLFGGTGNDTLYGGAGNDMLRGNGGLDTLFGEAGDDVFQAGTLDGDNFFFGGDGTDEIRALNNGANVGIAGDFGAANSIETITNAGFTGVQVWGDDDGNTLDFSTTTLTGISAIRGGDGNDTITGTGQADTIRGDNGDDVIFGGADDDRLFGGAGDDTLDGGTGNDSLTGGSGNDTFAFADGAGADTITDFDMADTDGDGFTNDQFDVANLTDTDGNPVNAWDVVVGDTNGDGTGDAVLTFPNGESVTLRGVTRDQVDTAMELHAIGIPCYVSGTLIQTDKGLVPVDLLRRGDMVLTGDGAYEPILWQDRTVIPLARLEASENLRPVRIKPGALGNDTALFVSQQHCLVVVHDCETRFIRAKHLAEFTALAHVTKPRQDVTYHHILLPEHAVIHANGALSESFYPGPQSVRMLSRQSLRELRWSILPKPWQSLSEAYGDRRLYCLKRKDLRASPELGIPTTVAPRGGLEAQVRPELV